MKNVLIIGYGVVGHNLYKELSVLKPDIYDKYKPDVNTKRNIKYDFAFICVDTPRINAENPCDVSQVISAINENDADIYIIKSTILPEILTKIIDDGAYHCKKIIFSPEYYGGTQHCNNFNFDFTILGGVKDTCYKVQQLLQEVYDGRHKFAITDVKTAALAKYMDNSWITFKVSFMTMYYDLSKKLGVHYEELRELFLLDERNSRSMTYVYSDHDYWDSHCTNKDVPAIAETYKNELPLINNMIDYNEKRKKKQ